MGTLSPVFRGALPISVREFAEILRSISPPRYPAVGANPKRDVAIAVSGGVDSMALAYLCSRLYRHDINFAIADNPVNNFRAIVIDHQLRDGSGEEANAVCVAVRKMGMSCDVYDLVWSKTGALDREHPHPKDLPNLESLARTLRYQKLGYMCSLRRNASLLLGHHEDDQYETVLMRLLQGHGLRGLRGMKPASPIPECEGIHGASESGHVDDQRASRPFYSYNVSRQQSKYLRRQLRYSIDQAMNGQELMDSTTDGLDDWDYVDIYRGKGGMTVDLTGIEVEDGGVMLYRPLLQFSKDRLIATCEANKIPWWEDSTNQDQTLTMRNAVRHMVRHYTLPVALQKPSILALSQRAEQQARALEAEANRLLEQVIIHDVDPNVGTASVQFPQYSLSRFPRDISSPARRRNRLLRQREVAGLLINRIIALVTPEDQATPVANLQNVISRLFPGLSNSPDADNIEEPPKAFVIAGVHFVPINPSSTPSSKGAPSKTAGPCLAWYLSRTPYPSHRPVPRYRTGFWSDDSRLGIADDKWSRWLPWALWDGRFWIRIRHRLPYRVILQPFHISHAKAFRESLAPEDKDHLGAVLKRCAPGKTRFTLPALYLEEYLDLSNADNVRPRRGYPISPAILKMEYNIEVTDDPTSEHPYPPDISKMRLVALPSLDIQLPHVDRWIDYEIRFRRIDRGTLNTAGSFHRGSFRRAKSKLRPRSLRLKRAH
ncbi:adenine nucleotide alpha hydrolases-like protein [Xylaria venustula]|nr:adenine nucleotide alpha hydrolases-like protein [Xylaria venustula]